MAVFVVYKQTEDMSDAIISLFVYLLKWFHFETIKSNQNQLFKNENTPSKRYEMSNYFENASKA